MNREGQKVTVFPKTLEQAGFDREPKITERELPIDEFRSLSQSKKLHSPSSFDQVFVILGLS